MKKLFLVFALGANASLTAQGWVGNSGNNSVYPVNSTLGTTPINVGIGTNAPSAQLHTTSSVRFQGLINSDTPNRIIVQDVSGNLFWRNAASLGGGNNWSLIGNNNAVNPGVAANQNFLGTTTNHRLVIATGGVNAGNPTGPIERMTIMPTSGFVGVGTQPQNPSSLLTVGNGTSGLGNQANQGYLFKSVGRTDSTVEHLGFFNNDRRTSRSELTVSNSGNANGRWEDNFIAMMVHGDNFTYLGRNDYYLNQNNSGYALINAQSNAGNRSALRKFSIGTNTDSVPLSFYTNNIERIFITSEGNVGLGTLTPSHNLHVEGQVRITDLPMSNIGDNLVMADPTTGVLRSLSAGATNTFLRGDGTWANVPAGGGNTNNTCGVLNMVPRLTGANTYGCGQIFDNGTGVGIGSTGPFAYSTSTWRSTGTAATGTLRVRVSGVVAATGFIATSDKTLKSEIKSIENPNKLIEALEGKSYLWSNEFIKESGVDNGRHYGFLAQEVEKVLPEAIVRDENGRYGVEYNAFIPILVESQKEIIKENRELKTRLSVMEEKFVLLEKSISQICENGCAGLTRVTEENKLYQSIPNPTDKDALVNYFLVNTNSKAQIVLFSQEGKDLESHNLEQKVGSGSIRLSLDGLANGTYMYSLIVDNKVIDTKRLQIIK